MVDFAWQNSWKSFLQCVADLYNRGHPDEYVAEFFSGANVQWEGTVTRVNLESEHVPGIQFIMPQVEVAVRHGRIIREDHLYLRISSQDKDSWRTVKEGDVVSFLGQIRRMNDLGPFLPIRLYFHEDDEYVSVEVSISQGRPADAEN
jgi:hypothetical protein